MLTYEEHDLLAQAASMYYEEEIAQDAIAKAFGLSRVKVYRLLKQARNEQVIQFTVNWPIQPEPGLGRSRPQRRSCTRLWMRPAIGIGGAWANVGG